jgi:hypothetical protein
MVGAHEHGRGEGAVHALIVTVVAAGVNNLIGAIN